MDEETIKRISDAVTKAKVKTNAKARGRVDIGKMARQLGFALFSTNALPAEVVGVMYLNLTGKFSKDLGSTKLIALNKAFDELHQRFAIAHELGHYFLHESNCTEEDWEHAYAMTQDYEEGIEKEACRFAAMLLMEKKSFIESYEVLKKDIDNEEVDIIEKLSLQFGAPQSAVKRRMSELGLAYAA